MKRVLAIAGEFIETREGRMEFCPFKGWQDQPRVAPGDPEGGQWMGGSGGGGGGSGGGSNDKKPPKPADKKPPKNDKDPAKIQKIERNADSTVKEVHDGRGAVKPAAAKKELAKTDLSLHSAEGGLEARGHTQEQVVDELEKNGWIKINSLADPDNPDFQLDIFEKGGLVATVHGQSEKKRKKLGRGDASRALPPHIKISKDE